MKYVAYFVLAIACISCSPRAAQTEALVDNEELGSIYEADQNDRRSGNIDWKVVSQRDSLRMARVYELLDSNKVRTSRDYANAAMIFQHGSDTVASGMAVKMMQKAIALDSSANKWLLAAAIDRDLMRRNLPQIYGTQYRKMAMDDPWKIYNLDSTQISDAERREYGVETLAEQREKLRMMNKKQLSEMLAAGKSIAEIVAFCKAENLKTSEYDLSESGINNLGYQLLAQDRNEEALQIFVLNTQLYPEGFNTYDSYGECLVKMGQVEAGIQAYEKSLVLNPDNENAKQVLVKLKK